jgi:DNA-binding NtrC family response regulator
VHRGVLWLDAPEGVRERIASDWRTRGWNVVCAGPERDPFAPGETCPEPPPDALIAAIPQPGGRGIDLLRRLARESAPPASIALCPAGMLEAGLLALKEGADDYVLAPLDPDELEIKLERALERRRERRELERLRGRHGWSRPARRITGESRALRGVRRQIERVAPGRATVLITGETGTGKELVAAAIHEASPRADRPFVKVNCAALPDALLESELFGHERGAFTGAEQRRLGRFEEAHRGTLFLDEIGDMHLRTQAKVLRVLQEQEFERLGGTRTIRVDVRILAATNQDLGDLIARGRFREDLFFRLHVVSICLPPLRERPEDVPLLADQFLRELNDEMPRPERGISEEAIDALSRYRWPGNVRELRNAIERAVLMGEGERIEVADLGLAGRPAPERVGGEELVRLPPGGIHYREVERALILQALARVGWVQKEAARLLRMSRRKLNYRIRRLGITHPSWRVNRPRQADR